MDEGLGAFFGVIPGTVPPVPSAQVHAIGFPRQIAQGSANLGVILHHEAWGGTPKPLHEKLRKEKFQFPVTAVETKPPLSLNT